MKTRRTLRGKKMRLEMLKQKIMAAIILLVAAIVPFVIKGVSGTSDISVDVILVPLGLYLLFTRKLVITNAN